MAQIETGGLPLFDGASYVPAYDAERLVTQLQKVYFALNIRDRANRDTYWWTIPMLTQNCGGSGAGISARIRDLRKRKHGAHTILRRRKGDPHAGLFEYKLVPKR